VTSRLVATVALAAAATIPAAALQTPTFTSRAEAVRVDVLVTERGQPVRGLRAADFDVLDNGVRQQVEVVSFEQIPLNVVLTFDMSSSLTAERLNHLRDAATALLDGFKPDDRAALVTFSHVVTARSGLTSALDGIRASLAGVSGSGWTALFDGTYTAMAIGESDVGRSLVIVFSDGLDTASWLRADAVLATARRADVVLYAVSATSQRADFLRELAEITGGRLFENKPVHELKPIFLAILAEFRHRYLLTYSPKGVTPGGWHRLEVRIKGRRATVRARPGYQSGQ
jgi:VWFA-related protein